MILINDTVAGHGETAAQERAAGAAEISVTAENHRTRTFTVDIAEGELVDLSVSLTPLSREAFRVEVPGGDGIAVYRGAQYIGTAPLILDLPLGEYEYFSIAGSEGKTGSLAVQTGDGPPGNVLSINSFTPAEDKPVDRARRQFYGAYGRFWIALPVAFIMTGVSNSVVNAYNTRGDPNLEGQANAYYWISIGTIAVAGVFLVESIVRIFIYGYTASENTTTLAK
jgi:hypothetical protein